MTFEIEETITTSSVGYDVLHDLLDLSHECTSLTNIVLCKCTTQTQQTKAPH